MGNLYTAPITGTGKSTGAEAFQPAGVIGSWVGNICSDNATYLVRTKAALGVIGGVTPIVGKTAEDTTAALKGFDPADVALWDVK